MSQTPLSLRVPIMEDPSILPIQELLFLLYERRGTTLDPQFRKWGTAGGCLSRIPYRGPPTLLCCVHSLAQGSLGGEWDWDGVAQRRGPSPDFLPGLLASASPASPHSRSRPLAVEAPPHPALTSRKAMPLRPRSADHTPCPRSELQTCQCVLDSHPRPKRTRTPTQPAFPSQHTPPGVTSESFCFPN